MKAFIIFTFCLLTVPYICQADTRSQALRAAYSYNFSKFISFSGQQGNITLCYLGSSDHQFDQFNSLNGKPLPNGIFNTKRITSTNELSQCKMLYTDSNEDIATATSKQQIVIISDNPSHKPMFSFIEKGNKLFFEVDINKAQKLDIDISSKLLRLAIIKKP